MATSGGPRQARLAPDRSGEEWGKVEATFQVASNKGWLEIAKTLNVYISAPRGAREDLSPVLECSVCALLYYSTFGEQSQR